MKLNINMMKYRRINVRKTFIFILLFLFVLAFRAFGESEFKARDYYGFYINVFYIKEIPDIGDCELSTIVIKKMIPYMDKNKTYCLIISDKNMKKYNSDCLFCYKKVTNDTICGFKIKDILHPLIIFLGSNSKKINIGGKFVKMDKFLAEKAVIVGIEKMIRENTQMKIIKLR